MHRIILVILLSLLITACGSSDEPPPAQPKQIEVTRIVTRPPIEVTRIVEVTTVVERVVTATPLPATPTPKPTATSKAPQLASRSNPVPFGESYPLVMNDVKQFAVAITDSVRGDEAYQKLLDANQFNDAPDQGMEYLMLFVTINYQSGPDDDPLQLDQYDLKVVAKGQIIDPASAVEPDPQFDISFFPGATGGGWVAFQIPADDPDPLMAIGMDFAGRGGFYFATHP